jgi:hypothetical protein
MGPDVNDKCMENTAAVFYFRNGGILRYAKKKLETIVAGSCKENTNTICLWNFLHCSGAGIHNATLLHAAYRLHSKSCTSVVFGKYFYICVVAIARILLAGKMKKGNLLAGQERF